MQIDRSGLIYERVRATKFERGYIVVFCVTVMFQLNIQTVSYAGS